MPLIVTAAQILAGNGPEDEDAPRAGQLTLAGFAAQLLPLEADGLTRRQIGVRLGMSESAVKSRIRRAVANGLLPPRGERQTRPQPAALTPAQVTAIRAEDREAFIGWWRDQHGLAS